MSKIAFYPGSFDPIHYGHIGVIKDATSMFDHVIVGVTDNVNKRHYFNHTERISMILNALTEFRIQKKVSIVGYRDFTADVAKKYGVDAIIRGVRDGYDFDYEMNMASVNRMFSEIPTLLIPCKPIYTGISSSLVREVIKAGKLDRLWKLVPMEVAFEAKKKLNGGG